MLVEEVGRASRERGSFRTSPGLPLCAGPQTLRGRARSVGRMNPTPRTFECVEGPAEMPVLAPRPMPDLRLACPAKPGAKQRYRMPLWRLFEKLGD